MKRWRGSGPALLAGLMILTFAVQAGGPLVLSHRNLFTLCAPMDLSVEPIRGEQSRRIGLASGAIENEIESRLRAAHLFKTDTSQYLSVEVNLSQTGDAFSASLSLNRYVNDMGYGIGGFVTVWRTSTLGSHGGDNKPVLSAIALLADEFLANYLRGNEVECGHK